MAYLRYYDDRYGDLYEVYFDSETGEFRGARRNVGEVGHDVIYYDQLGELPVYHRRQIEKQIWKLLHPQS
jgi:hypothetical protein